MATGAAVLSIGAAASAAVPVCDPSIPDLSGCCYKKPNAVFVAGTSAAKSALQAIAAQLTDISIIYQTPDSCIALADVESGQAATGANVTTTYLAPDGTTPACALSPSANTNAEEAINIAVSDIFPSTCQSVLGMGGVTAGQQIDVLGPIQGQTIDVPSTAAASSISAEAAYVVFGYGATTYMVPPWTVPANVFIRPSTSGTLNLIGTVIGLAGAKWANATNAASPQVETSSALMFTAISTATSNIEATIGILSAQFVLQQNAKALATGGNGKTIKTLAFQAKDQSCGYFPDSVANSGDKMNVRQGRYAIWGPAHLVANVGADGNPKGVHAAAVTEVLNAFIATGCEGSSCPPGSNKLFGPLAAESNVDAATSDADGGADGGDAGGGIAAPSAALKKALILAESAPAGGVVPWCAMQVTRGNVEAGGEASYQPSEPCGCYFEKLATGATVSPYCKACPIGNECVAPYSVCRYGYCEAK